MLLISCLVSLHCSSQVERDKLFAGGASAVTLHKTVQEVDVVFSVSNRHGHLVRTLTSKDISIYDNGEPPSQITYFESEARLPLRLALVIDTSDSVVGYAGDEKRAANLFLKHILRSSSDLALVIGFNQHARLEQVATHDLHLLTRATHELSLGGKTAIFDAVKLASTELAQVANNQPSLRAIIIMTDGDDNASTTSLQEVTRIAQQNESLIYALNTGAKSLWSARAEGNMKQLAESTGGRYFLADQEHIYTVLSQIEQELRSQYAVGYKPATTRPDGSFHQISIVVPKKLHVRHRAGYFAR